jgi:hypothetical protein
MDVEQLEKLQQDGLISRYTLIVYDSGSLAFCTPGSAELHFVTNGMGIEPNQYPLAGSLTIGEPGGIGLPTLLQQVGDLVITRDLAEEYALHLGDTITLSDLRTGIPLQAAIRGIAYNTTNHQGGTLYYSIDTAQALAGGEPILNVAIANTPQVGAASSTLIDNGWRWPQTAWVNSSWEQESTEALNLPEKRTCYHLLAARSVRQSLME